MEPLIFDSHAHYDDKRFNSDRDALLKELPQKGIRYLLNVGANLKSSRASIALANRYDYIYASVGIHPHDAEEVSEQALEKLRHWATTEPKVRAIGEIGLDYYYGGDRKEIQKEAFERQLILVKELDMPVIIHSRDATEDTLNLLQKYQPKGIVHCFSGSAEMAKEVLKLGMYIGLTGVLTFKNAKKAIEVVKVTPLDRLLLETDCPYMAPEPYRGKRCDSSMLVMTAQKMAEIKEISTEDIMRITCENACRVYNIL